MVEQSPMSDARLQALEAKIDALYVSVEKLRMYFLWTGIISVALIVLPLIGLLFALPSFFSAEGISALQGL